METTAKTKDRPFGIKAIIFLHLLAGILPLVDFFIFADPNIATVIRTYFVFGADFIASDERIIGGILITFAIFQIVLVIGLWQMRHWAWLLVMITTGITMATQIWRYFNDLPDYLGMAVNVIVVFYLNQRDVQQAFKQEQFREGER